MKPELTRPTWEDVIFESRNKEYGAYAIRKSYDENVTKASLIMIFVAAFIFAGLQVASLMHVKIKLPIVKTPTGPLPPPTIIKDPVIKPQTLKAEPQTNHDLLERVVTREVEPIPVQPIDPLVQGSETGTETGQPLQSTGVDLTGTDVPQVIEPPKVLDIAEVMPEYNGGVSAMIRFLQRNLRYPASMRHIGTEGTVYVRFVIDGQGAVTNIEVIKSVHAVLDKEAMRVIAMMPNWKPGRQHNSPVSVRMVLPIKFALEKD